MTLPWQDQQALFFFFNVLGEDAQEKRLIIRNYLPTGLLYDHLGTYNIAFHIAGCPPILGALLMFFIPKATPVSIVCFCQCALRL